jgi:hypothetical protein
MSHKRRSVNVGILETAALGAEIEPVTTPQPTTPNWESSARLWSKVRVTSDAGACWLWRGQVGTSGYGQLKMGGKMVSAHRLAVELTAGPIPDGLVVQHRCDVKRCVNPNHLIVGTQADNMRDAAIRGLMSRPRVGRQHLSPDAVAVIRAAFPGPKGTATILAKHFGVTPSCISYIARGKRRVYDENGLAVPRPETIRGQRAEAQS